MNFNHEAKNGYHFMTTTTDHDISIEIAFNNHSEWQEVILNGTIEIPFDNKEEYGMFFKVDGELIALTNIIFEASQTLEIFLEEDHETAAEEREHRAEISSLESTGRI